MVACGGASPGAKKAEAAKTTSTSTPAPEEGQFDEWKRRRVAKRKREEEQARAAEEARKEEQTRAAEEARKEEQARAAEEANEQRIAAATAAELAEACLAGLDAERNPGTKAESDMGEKSAAFERCRERAREDETQRAAQLNTCETRAKPGRLNCEDNCSVAADSCRNRAWNRPNARQACGEKESQCSESCVRAAERQCSRYAPRDAEPCAAEWAAATAAKASLRNARRCEAGAMAQLSGGTFTPADSEEPVTLRPFSLDRTEVTVNAYAKCLAAGKCSEPGLGAGCNWWSQRERGNHPINCIDWRQASAYCEWADKRLPSEVEWEWAARGQDQGTTYSWGDDEPAARACWNGEDNSLGIGLRRGTCPVGAYPRGASPDGLYDLAGNVAEWTGSAGVVRGGSWFELGAQWLGSKSRPRVDASTCDSTLGLRCAIDGARQASDSPPPTQPGAMGACGCRPSDVMCNIKCKSKR
jgi:formylglycine-generating enzyme required for sulfatase activity